VAIPAGNDPASGNPATVTIIDATSAKRLESKSLLILPADAFITFATPAILSGDGRFCFIASSFNEPALFSFDIETGQLVSRHSLIGRPSEMAYYVASEQSQIAIASSVANSLSILKVDRQGQLSAASEFSPAGARFGDSNNPAFSADGRTVFMAAADGDILFAVDSESGILIDSFNIESPQRISAATRIDGAQLIAATRAGKGSDGVTIFKYDGGRFVHQSEFNPPEGVKFSRANNVSFTHGAEVAFTGAATGWLFAFNVETGELESYHEIGSELRRVTLSESAQTVAAVRSSATGDEVVMVSFDMVASDDGDSTTPFIEDVSPKVVQQGKLKNVKVKAVGVNFTQGSSFIVNGAEIPAALARGGRALEARLPKEMFDQLVPINIQVRTANGALSQPVQIRVVRPDAPVIDLIRPSEVAGPSDPFTLKVRGSNFRSSSTIFVGDRSLNTEQLNATTLLATVPAEMAQNVGTLKVQVKDLALADLVSANDKELLIYGPRIKELLPSVNAVVAGDERFTLRIRGENFREGAEVLINGQVVAAKRVLHVGRTLIKLVVPGDFFQDAGDLSVVVRNPSGGASDPEELRAHGPKITPFTQSKVYAGQSDVKVEIRGENFRRRARIYVGNSNGAVRLERRHVRFRNSTRIIVTITGELNGMLAQSGDLRFKVVNPNKGDGVASGDEALHVLGPEIEESIINPVNDDAAHKRIVIVGDNFRKGAIVEFLKDGQAVLQREPVSFSETRLTVKMRTRRLEALGQFSMRVINPNNVPSNPSRPRHELLADSNE
jgi:outer membrane protein assembly factor BamB